MKRHIQQPGVRQWAGEDLVELQSEPLKALDGFFSAYGPCIIQGCQITNNGNATYNISSGLLALGGTDVSGSNTFKVIPFSGASNVPLPIYFTLAYSVVERSYLDGKVKPIAYNYHAAISTLKPNGNYLELSTENIIRFVDVLQCDEMHRFFSDEERKKLAGLNSEDYAPKNFCPYPVGGIFITKSRDNPAVKWPGTTWVKIEGKFLYGTLLDEESGVIGGDATATLNVDNLPTHNHDLSGSTNESGSHSHTAGNHRHQVDSHSHTQPSHTHRVKMSNTTSGGNSSYLVGQNGGNYGSNGSASGDGWGTSTSSGGDSTGSSSPYTNYVNPTTSSSGSHSHSLSGKTANTGGGREFSILPPYLKVHMWERKS